MNEVRKVSVGVIGNGGCLIGVGCSGGGGEEVWWYLT